MNNFKFYVQELRKMFSMYNDYTIDSIMSVDNDINHQEYLVPEKVSDVKKKGERKRPYTIRVTRSSPAYDFFLKHLNQKVKHQHTKQLHLLLQTFLLH